MRSVSRRSGGRQSIFTEEVMEAIPLWLKLGADRRDIAAILGTTVASLSFACSQRGVSLRPISVGIRTGIGRERWAVLQREAELRGTSVAQLMMDLVSKIVDDKLFAAVLDDEGGG